jgi:hypothetical protein
MDVGVRAAREYHGSAGGLLKIRAMVVLASSRPFVTGYTVLGDPLRVEFVAAQAFQHI